MSDTEPRRIKKVVRKVPKLTQKEVSEIAVGDPFPVTPAGQTRRGAITTQKVTITPSAKDDDYTYALTKPRAVEGHVTLPQLASERGIQSQLARIWVINAGIKKTDNRWQWKKESKALARVRNVLGLKP